jgi:hypothetical protein
MRNIFLTFSKKKIGSTKGREAHRGINVPENQKAATCAAVPHSACHIPPVLQWQGLSCKIPYLCFLPSGMLVASLSLRSRRPWLLHKYIYIYIFSTSYINYIAIPLLLPLPRHPLCSPRLNSN